MPQALEISLAPVATQDVRALIGALHNSVVVPAAPDAAQTAGAASVAGPVVQSIIIGPGRKRAAIIGGERVEVRRPDERMTDTGQRVAAPLVDRDEQDVAGALAGVRGGNGHDGETVVPGAIMGHGHGS